MNHLSPLARKMIAWSIVLILSIAVTLYGFLPLYSMQRTARAEYEQKTTLLDRYRLRLARLDRQETSDREAIGAVLKAGLILRSTDRRLAVAELREYLNASVAAAGAELQSSQDVNREDPDVPIESASLEASMTVTLGQLQDILYSLESRLPLLRIEALRVRRGRMVRGSAEIPLNVQLTMTGYIYPDAGS